MSRQPKPATPPTTAACTPPGRLAYRLGELAQALSISRRTLERERSAGRFPSPDLVIGKAPLWTPETIRRWIEGGGAR